MTSLEKLGSDFSPSHKNIWTIGPEREVVVEEVGMVFIYDSVNDPMFGENFMELSKVGVAVVKW